MNKILERSWNFVRGWKWEPCPSLSIYSPCDAGWYTSPPFSYSPLNPRMYRHSGCLLGMEKILAAWELMMLVWISSLSCFLIFCVFVPFWQNDTSRENLYNLARDRIETLQKALMKRTYRLPENVDFQFLRDWIMNVRGWPTWLKKCHMENLVNELCESTELPLDYTFWKLTHYHRTDFIWKLTHYHRTDFIVKSDY